MFNRRGFLTASMGALGLSGVRLCQAAEPTLARRPAPPYRVWFQPRCFHRDTSLYQHMTIDASGWLDPALCEAAGKTGLRWVYGTNHPQPESSSYWKQECAAEVRTVPWRDGQFTSAGVAIDEWVQPQHPQVEQYLADGLRAARQQNPELFITVWYTDLRPALIELIQDGTVDLAIIEGYTHTPKRFGPEAWLAWSTCLRRCELAREAKTLEKTIFCFGHITDEPSIQGEHLTTNWLDEKVREIKERYPQMPGIAYYQSDSKDSPHLRHLVRHCDQLSGRFWKS